MLPVSLEMSGYTRTSRSCLTIGPTGGSAGRSGASAIPEAEAARAEGRAGRLRAGTGCAQPLQ